MNIRPCLGLKLALILLISGFAGTGLVSAKEARGVVFEDINRNGVRDTGEPGLAGVPVSNQREVRLTETDGSWSLPYDKDTTFFVVKPSSWAVPLDANNLPQFYYIHKPGGSPKRFKYQGVDPTGPLPKTIDFPLHRQIEPERFQTILFGDPQPRSQEQVDFISHT